MKILSYYSWLCYSSALLLLKITIVAKTITKKKKPYLYFKASQKREWRLIFNKTPIAINMSVNDEPP